MLLISVLSQMKAVHNLAPCFFNIILPSTLRSPNWLLPFWRVCAGHLATQHLQWVHLPCGGEAHFGFAAAAPDAPERVLSAGSAVAEAAESSAPWTSVPPTAQEQAKVETKNQYLDLG